MTAPVASDLRRRGADSLRAACSASWSRRTRRCARSSTSNRPGRRAGRVLSHGRARARPRGGAARAAAGLPGPPGVADGAGPRGGPRPAARGRATCPAGGALHAYEQAMEQLRDQGEEMSAAPRGGAAPDGSDPREASSVPESSPPASRGRCSGLGTIVGYARLLERASLPEDAHAIREECETLETVVRRFTDFVKLERLQLGETDLARGRSPASWPASSGPARRCGRGSSASRLRSSCAPTRSCSSGRSRTWSATLSRPRRPAAARRGVGSGERRAGRGTDRRRRPWSRPGPPRRDPALLHHPARGARARTPAGPEDRPAPRRVAGARRADAVWGPGRRASSLCRA